MNYNEPLEADVNVLALVREAIEARDGLRISLLLEGLHGADTADILEQISPVERSVLLELWHGGIDGEVLSEIDESIREEVIEALPQAVVAEAVRELDSDDVVDILEDLDEPAQERILDALEDADRVAVEAAMAYPEYSAGRLMQRETVVAPQDWTVGQAIDWVRSATWLPDQFYHVILVDPRMRPVGYVTLGRLMSSPRVARLNEIAESSFRTVKVTDPESDVAYIFNQYHLISCPVIDENNRLVGVITIDDAMTVLDEEHEEDMLRLARVSDDSSIQDGVLVTVKSRIPWLFVNLLTANISALVVGQFSTTIGQIVILAALMPIIASMGGIAGTQSLTIAVRALATRDLTVGNAMRVVRREALVGMINGMAFAIIMGLAGWLVLGMPMLGVVLALAMVINLVVAALAGILVPLGLVRLKFDPALAGGTFVMTMTDVIGFFVFLALATVMLV